MPRSANHLLSFGLASALIAGGAQLAWSQGLEKTISITKAFEPDLADLSPGGAGTLKTVPKSTAMPGVCNKGPVVKTFVARGGDSLFAKTLGGARTEVLDAAMRGDGHVIFATEWVYGSMQEDGNVEVRWDTLPDKQNPKLDTKSNPKKGTKVQEGKAIEVTMTAKDDANLWQSGIHIIQLTGEPGGLVDKGLKVYGRELRCQPATLHPPPLKATYTVPPNPPPIVRLRATAEDFAGNPDVDVGEFPTGDWYGRIEVDQKGVSLPPVVGESMYRYSVDLALDYDDKGNLTGSALGHATFKSIAVKPLGAWGMGCEQSESEETEETVTPAKIKGTLLGSLTPGRAIAITVGRDESTEMVVRHRQRILKGSRCGGEFDKRVNRGGDLQSVESFLSSLSPVNKGFENDTGKVADGQGGYFRIRVWLRQAEK